jgi:hypothetical protein
MLPGLPRRCAPRKDGCVFFDLPMLSHITPYT